MAQLRLKSTLDKPRIKSNERGALWEFHQQINLNLSSFGYYTHVYFYEKVTKALLCLLCAKKEFSSLSLIMLVKWEAYFKPLADVVATQGKTNICFSNEKISSYDRHMNNVFHRDSL